MMGGKELRELGREAGLMLKIRSRFLFMQKLTFFPNFDLDLEHVTGVRQFT